MSEDEFYSWLDELILIEGILTTPDGFCFAIFSLESSELQDWEFVASL